MDNDRITFLGHHREELPKTGWLIVGIIFGVIKMGLNMIMLAGCSSCCSLSTIMLLGAATGLTAAWIDKPLTPWGGAKSGALACLIAGVIGAYDIAFAAFIRYTITWSDIKQSLPQLGVTLQDSIVTRSNVAGVCCIGLGEVLILVACGAVASGLWVRLTRSRNTFR